MIEEGHEMTTRRLSPIQMSEEGAELIRCRGTSPAAPASLTDDEDLLREILLLLPSQPSSLPRASSVCKRWRRVVTDPQFLSRFRTHHRKPPLLGVFEQSKIWSDIVFRSILDPPDRIPPECFSLQRHDDVIRKGSLLGCRHGRLLILDRAREEVVVCDAITGERRRVGVPAEFRRPVTAAVLCAAGDQDHVHGHCYSSPFKVVLLTTDIHYHGQRPIACVYSSETGVWGNLISTAVPCMVDAVTGPSTFAGNALYWLLMCNGILEFDLDRQSLAVIKGPPVTNQCSQWIVQAEDDGVGVAMLSYPSFQMWQRKVNCHGVATWVLWKTVEMHSILGLPPMIEGRRYIRVGYAEEADAIFLLVDNYVYMVQLESMQARRLYQTSYRIFCHPFMSFYTADETTMAAAVLTE